MKAIKYRGPGGYEVIEIGDRDVRAPGPDEVRIDVKAAAVNPTDILLRDRGGSGNTLPPWTPGMDAAGIVESVGAGVDRLRVGDKVMAVVLPQRPDGGAQAAQVVVPAASVTLIPNGVSLAQASTLPMNGLTALLGLELAGLKAGDSLAVSGGAGHLARLVIGIARHRGLNVIADAKPSDVDRVRSYGANVVVARGPDFCAAVRQAVPEGVDALFDTALLLEKSFPAIRDGGVYLPVRGWGVEPSKRNIQIKPVFVNTAAERTEWLEQLRDLVSSGHLQLEVAAEYPPEQVADAQRSLAVGGLRGRPVIVFDHANPRTSS
jgi:NADPH:quinone reductase